MLLSTMPSAFAQSQPSYVRGPLKLTTLVGDDAIDDVTGRQATTPVIEVRDANDLPVENAKVTFVLPASGPGGEFRDGAKSFETRTNLQGQAQAPYTMNSELGEFDIQVTAEFGDRAAQGTITQLHIDGSPEEYLRKRDKRWYKSKAFWAVVGGAAAGAVIAIAVTGDSGNSSVVFTPGPPSVGGPQ